MPRQVWYKTENGYAKTPVFAMSPRYLDRVGNARFQNLE